MTNILIKSSILFSALAIANLWQPSTSAASEPPFDRAAHVWTFSPDEAATSLPIVNLPGDGTAVEIRGSGAEIKEGDAVRIAVQGDYTIATRCYLDESYFDLTHRKDTVLFEWIGKDTTSEAKRHFISLEILNIGHIGENRYLGFFIDNRIVNVSLKKLKSAGWYDIVLRVKDHQAELFVDGILRARKPLTGLDLRADPPDPYVISDDYLLIGSNHRQDRSFDGRIDHLAIWNEAADDTTLATLSGVPELDNTWKQPNDWHTNWAGFYEEDISRDEAYRRMYEDYVRFYRRSLKEDIYFPRYHLVMPGYMTEPSMLSRTDGAYHIFPHGHIGWRGVTYEEAHFWHHIMSDDLVHWKLMPFPAWDNPNAGNMVRRKTGDTMCFPFSKSTDQGVVFEQWTSPDQDLESWDPKQSIVIPPATAGHAPKDNYIFEHDGSTWMIGGYAAWSNQDPQLKGKLELYRATDDTLENWEYAGVFYQGETDFSHHPRVFLVDGKCILDSDVPIDKGVWYLLGEIENNQFVKQGGGDFNFGFGWSWGQTITEPGGRVLRWTLLRNLCTENNLLPDKIRRGWGNIYSLPRVMGVKDLTLQQTPAPELTDLREKSLYAAPTKTVKAGSTFFPELSGNSAAVELRCKLRISEAGTAGLELNAGNDDRIRFAYNANTKELSLDTAQSKCGGTAITSGQHAHVRTHLDSRDASFVELRLFFDHSVVEVYADGLCSAARWYPDSPKDIQVGWFAENTDAVFDELNIWQMGTIWTPTVKMEPELNSKSSPAAFLYEPDDAVIADVIPYYHNDQFHILHLQLKPGQKGWDWAQIKTLDFTSFEHTGIAIPSGGTEESQDLDIYTGSVIEKEGLLYAFYTGNNRHLKAQGKAHQQIFRAISEDGIHWKKDPNFLLNTAGNEAYHFPHACRDPFVFRNPEKNEYGMLITAAAKKFPKGSLGYASSPDLDHWTLEDPFPASGRFPGYECPDLFRWGDRWYLLFSTYSNNPGWATRYMTAPSLDGPWESPADDFLDGGSLYAAKSVPDGDRRFLCGTLTRRQKKQDDDVNGWSGRLIAYEMIQRNDGTLGVRIPQAVEESFGPAKELKLPVPVGNTTRLPLGKLPSRCLVSFELIVPPTGRTGIWVGGNEKSERAFRLYVDVGTRRLVWDRGSLPLGGDPDKERPWRPLPNLQPGDKIHIKVALDGNAAIACLDDSVCLSTRIYDRREDNFGIWSDTIGAEFHDLRIRQP